MKIIDRIWRPSPKERSSGSVLQSRYSELKNNSAAASPVSILNFSTVPYNTLRVVSIVGGFNGAGAGQICTRATLQLVSSNGQVILTYNFEPNYVHVAAENWYWGFQLGDGIAMKVGEQLQYFGYFSAGGVANTVNCNLYGYDMPIGNVQ